MLVKAVVTGNYPDGFNIAREVNAEVIGITEKVFPDGEQYVRLDEPDKVRDSTILVISTMYPMQDQSLLKLLILADALARNQAREFIGVIPYLAYSRQDKVFMPGEPVSASTVLRILKSAGYSRLVVVDFHSNSLLSDFKSYLVNILVSDLLVKAVVDKLDKPVILAPDKGALERARFAAESIGLDYDYLVKSRDRVTGAVSYAPREVSVEGRDVVIVDDIISTGGTIAEASRILLKQGARRIFVAASHGLMIGNALSRIMDAGVQRIILANTLSSRLEHPLVEYVDISSRIASVLRELIQA
nr:ribose-phosphate diphosphokinase [Desulfurococcus amylolyticus]